MEDNDIEMTLDRFNERLKRISNQLILTDHYIKVLEDKIENINNSAYEDKHNILVPEPL